MLRVEGLRRLRMRFAIIFCANSKNECGEDEKDHFLFLAGEDEPLAKCRQFFAPIGPLPLYCHM